MQADLSFRRQLRPQDILGRHFAWIHQLTATYAGCSAAAGRLGRSIWLSLLCAWPLLGPGTCSTCKQLGAHGGNFSVPSQSTRLSWQSCLGVDLETPQQQSSMACKPQCWCSLTAGLQAVVRRGHLIGSWATATGTALHVFLGLPAHTRL